MRFIDNTDLSDTTRPQDFQIDTLTSWYTQGLTILLAIVLSFLLVTTVFMEKVYFCSFIISLFFERKLIIHVLFLSPISTLVTHGTIESL